MKKLLNDPVKLEQIKAGALVVIAGCLLVTTLILARWLPELVQMLSALVNR